MMRQKLIKDIFFIYVLTQLFVLSSCSDDEEVSMPLPQDVGTWIDERDHTEYGWVRYGDLEWTTSNLRYKTYEGVTFPDMSPVYPGYYDDGVSKRYYEKFGFLYDFNAAVSAVPDGWRLPTNDDWEKLYEATNGNIAKAIDMQLGGYYLSDEYFQQIHNVDYNAYKYGCYWSSTIDNSKPNENFAYYRKITYNSSFIDKNSINITNYLSVRLVRDANK